MNRAAHSSIILAAMLLVTLTATAVPVRAADVFLVDEDAGTAGAGALFRLDTGTGRWALVSDFGDVGQGPAGKDPTGVAVTGRSTVVVIDRGAGHDGKGALYRVDTVTGIRTMLSDFGDRSQGLVGGGPSSIAVEASGATLVVDPKAGRGHRGSLVRVNPVTGARSLLSDFGDHSQGPTGEDPSGVAIDTDGTILVIDPSAGDSGMLFRVDAMTGARTLVSDFGDPGQGPTGGNPSGVATEPSGSILVIDPSGILFRIDPVTGARTVLSDFVEAGQGPRGYSSTGVAVDQTSGAIFVADPGAGSAGRLFGVDPLTGARSLLNEPGTGVAFPTGVVVGPSALR